MNPPSEPVPPHDTEPIVGAPGSAPPPPPPTWLWPRENERIEVEVAGEDEGSASTWMKATVTAVLIDGWFSARMEHDLEWVDWFTWQEVRTDAQNIACTQDRACTTPCALAARAAGCTHANATHARALRLTARLVARLVTRRSTRRSTPRPRLRAPTHRASHHATSCCCTNAGGHRLAPRSSGRRRQDLSQTQGKWRLFQQARFNLGQEGSQRGRLEVILRSTGCIGTSPAAAADCAHILGDTRGVHGRAARRVPRAVAARGGNGPADQINGSGGANEAGGGVGARPREHPLTASCHEHGRRNKRRWCPASRSRAGGR